MPYEVSPENGISDYFYCRRHINSRHPSRIHSHLEIIFVFEDALEINVSGKSYTVKSGEMVFVMPYEVHSYFIDGGNAFVIACPPEYVPEYREIFGGREFECPITRFTDIHKEIMWDIENDNFADNFKKKALIYYSLSELVKNCNLKEKNLFEYDVYRKAIVYISEHYTENISMESVAKYVGVSASHLSRVLNSDGKPGFSEILNSLRIHAAKKLLERENISVSEAAFETGYGSIRNFNRVFKEYFGCKPSDIRKSE